MRLLFELARALQRDQREEARELRLTAAMAPSSNRFCGHRLGSPEMDRSAIFSSCLLLRRVQVVCSSQNHETWASSRWPCNPRLVVGHTRRLDRRYTLYATESLQRGLGTYLPTRGHHKRPRIHCCPRRLQPDDCWSHPAKSHRGDAGMIRSQCLVRGLGVEEQGMHGSTLETIEHLAVVLGKPFPDRRNSIRAREDLD